MKPQVPHVSPILVCGFSGFPFEGWSYVPTSSSGSRVYGPSLAPRRRQEVGARGSREDRRGVERQGGAFPGLRARGSVPEVASRSRTRDMGFGVTRCSLGFRKARREKGTLRRHRVETHLRKGNGENWCPCFSWVASGSGTPKGSCEGRVPDLKTRLDETLGRPRADFILGGPCQGHPKERTLSAICASFS